MDSNKEVISKLKFIGKIQKGEKINVKFMFIQPDGFVTKISRTVFYYDNRKNTLSFVQETINRSLEIINNSVNSSKPSDEIMCKHIMFDLKQAKQGLINLKDTYVLDIKFCCDMDTFLQLIESKLTELYDKYPVLSDETYNERTDSL